MEDDGKIREKQKANVRKRLKEQGFALELETYLAIKKRGWFASMQSFYTNTHPESQNKSVLEIIRDTWNTPPEPEFRTIDITAVKVIPSKITEISIGSLTLIIECKWRKDENWVFYTESVAENQALGVIGEGVKFMAEDPRETLGALSFGEISSFGKLTRLQIKNPANREIVRNIRETSHHSVRNMDRFALSHKTVFRPDSPDNVFNACRQVMGACSFFGRPNPENMAQMMDDRKAISYWRIYPVVIFSGDIWEARFDENQELQLESRGWLTYLYPHKGELNSIDIISIKSLSDYLDTLDRECASLEKVLSQSKEE